VWFSNVLHVPKIVSSIWRNWAITHPESTDRQPYFCSHPCLIVEVLSESTERIDRREKLLAYQTLPSLQEYALVAQNARRVEIYRRTNDWKAEYFDSGEIRLDCLESSVSVDAIYADVESFEAPAPDSI
jgi:Uma2 family endonuclease